MCDDVAKSSPSRRRCQCFTVMVVGPTTAPWAAFAWSVAVVVCAPVGDDGASVTGTGGREDSGLFAGAPFRGASVDEVDGTDEVGARDPFTAASNATPALPTLAPQANVPPPPPAPAAPRAPSASPAPDVLRPSVADAVPLASEAPTTITVKHWRRILDGELFASSSRVEWSVLMQRTFGFDALRCPTCDARMRVMSTITDLVVVKKILSHLGMRTDPLPRARSRDPTGQMDFGDHAA
jgi:hypothetical protein